LDLRICHGGGNDYEISAPPPPPYISQYKLGDYRDKRDSSLIAETETDFDIDNKSGEDNESKLPDSFGGTLNRFLEESIDNSNTCPPAYSPSRQELANRNIFLPQQKIYKKKK
jgi:hypothetical protein